MIEDLPPGLEGLYRRFQNSLSDLNTRTAQFSWNDFGEPEPVGPIDEDMLARIAADPDSSQEIKSLADNVVRGRIAWAAVVAGHISLPPELRELVDMGIPFAIPQRPESQHPTAQSEMVGYPFDDDDEDQAPESWLE
ncbi:hypothetical protein [Nocardia cyriacigeorgica]|uniref:hypothetical protein n=1 Tax=Nocardia cyriacigeorgica TaxID=135487 RepID=UPI002455E6F7|nr:hypothetical protein [Nocardia cyriacigeorgica]